MPQDQQERSTLSDNSSGAALSGRWQLDPRDSSVEFRVATFWGLAKVKGHFERYEGRLELGATPAIELTIDAASLQTHNRRRDKHLRSADFFDAQNHPHVRFVAGAAELDEGTLRAQGDLSAAGRSIPLAVQARVRTVADGIEIEATATVPQRELGMAYNPLGMIASSSELLVKGRLTPT
ncbi:MAG: YceI family protein [Solirubrobacteraceae bacterium]